MSDTLEFRDWLIQPGNHRTFQELKQQVKRVLKQDVAAHSWFDIYRLFEMSLSYTDEAVGWFAPVITANPPSADTGASPKQILLYRGAYVNHDAIPAPDPSKTKKVTYRGQVFEKEVEQDHEAKSSSKPRYYRGAKVD